MDREFGGGGTSRSRIRCRRSLPDPRCQSLMRSDGDLPVSSRMKASVPTPVVYPSRRVRTIRATGARFLNCVSITCGSASWRRPTSTRSGTRGRRCCPATSRSRSAASAGCCAVRRSSATTATRSTTGSDSIPSGPIALGNIDTLQNFVHLYDEHWFILVHVEIEAIAARILAAIVRAARCARPTTMPAAVNDALAEIGAAVWRQVGVLRRHPREDGPGALLPDLPALHPLLRERRLRGGRRRR